MTLKQLQNIIEKRRQVEKAFQDANEVGIIDINSPFFNAMWQAIESVTRIVDPHGWIEWYIYENECGDMELTATVNDKAFKVKSEKDLLALIKESEKI